MNSILETLRKIYITHFDGANLPDKIIINKEKLKGTAFFPGGDGVFYDTGGERTSFPIMVLGQDFDNQNNFERLLNTTHQSEISPDKPNKTWGKLLGRSKNQDTKNGILWNEAYKIKAEDCFFTNIIMGLRKGDQKNHSRSIAFNKSNEEFLKKNIDFFEVQLDVVKPKLIIGLGAQIPNFVGRCFHKQGNISRLSKISSFKALDELENFTNICEIHSEYSFTGSPLLIVFITHPSFYDRNYRIRKINKERNMELDSIRECLELIEYPYIEKL